MDALVRALTACEAEWEDLRCRAAKERGSGTGAPEASSRDALAGQNAAIGRLLALLGRLASNVGELQNVIAHALIPSTDGRCILELSQPGERASAHPTPAAAAAPVLTETEMLELQRRNIVAALTRCGGVIYGHRGAARVLGVKPTTLIERMRRMGIRRPDRGVTS